MSSIVRASELQPEQLQMLGENVVHAVEHDGEAELSAVNRSLAVHGEAVDELACPAAWDGAAEPPQGRLAVPPKTPRRAGPSPRPAA